MISSRNGWRRWPGCCRNRVVRSIVLSVPFCTPSRTYTRSLYFLTACSMCNVPAGRQGTTFGSRRTTPILTILTHPTTQPPNHLPTQPPTHPHNLTHECSLSLYYDCSIYTPLPTPRLAGDDFRVEKDKCEMMRFFMANELPVVRQLRHRFLPLRPHFAAPYHPGDTPWDVLY